MQKNRKQELRQHFRQVRRDITAIEQSQANQMVCEQLRTLVENGDYTTIGVYFAIDDELNIIAFIEWLLKSDYHVAAPRINDEQIVFHQVDDLKKLATHPRWQIPEPQTDALILTPELLIVPGVAYDELGNRLGFGGGYYDRYLANYSGHSIGVCYQQCQAELPVEDHDQQVDSVIFV